MVQKECKENRVCPCEINIRVGGREIREFEARLLWPTWDRQNLLLYHLLEKPVSRLLHRKAHGAQEKPFKESVCGGKKKSSSIIRWHWFK